MSRAGRREAVKPAELRDCVGVRAGRFNLADGGCGDRLISQARIVIPVIASFRLIPKPCRDGLGPGQTAHFSGIRAPERDSLKTLRLFSKNSLTAGCGID
jgi:hypothetical protein